MSLGRGEWIKFVFQDDLLNDACLEKLLNSTDSKTQIACCRRDFLFSEGTEPEIRDFYANLPSLDSLFPGKGFISPEEFGKAVLDNHDVANFIGEPTNVILRRNVFFRYGTFNPHFILFCDYEFWVRVAIHTGLTYCSETLSTFRVHKSATTAFNNEKRSYRGLVLDRLLLLHEFNFNPVYEPIRTAAARQRGASDLMDLLAYDTRRAYRRAVENDCRNPAGAVEKKKEWEELLKYYPVLELFSKKFVVHSQTLKKVLKMLRPGRKKCEGN